MTWRAYEAVEGNLIYIKTIHTYNVYHLYIIFYSLNSVQCLVDSSCVKRPISVSVYSICIPVQYYILFLNETFILNQRQLEYVVCMPACGKIGELTSKSVQVAAMLTRA